MRPALEQGGSTRGQPGLVASAADVGVVNSDEGDGQSKFIVSPIAAKFAVT